MSRIINFNDGSSIDLEKVYDNAEIKEINLDDIIITFDKDYQDAIIGYGQDDRMQTNSLDTLRRSLTLFGQLSPITVSMTSTNKYQLIDGIKRYQVLKNDHVETIKAIIINEPIHESKAIIRFLINEKNYQSPNEIELTGKLVQSTTQDIRSSFIEKVDRLNIGDLNKLDLAIKIINENKKARDAALTRYQDNAYTLKEFIKRVFMINNHENTISKDKSEQSNQINQETESNYQNPESNKIKAQLALDKSRDISDMKNVSTNQPIDTDLNEFHELKPKEKKNNQDKERTVADAESLLRSKQQSTEPTLLDKQIDSNIQNVGERKPLSHELRQKVLKRDHYQCQICGAGGKDQPELVKTFEIHHLQDVQLNGPDKLDNLILLCPSCHKLITDYKSFVDKPIPRMIPEYNPSTQELNQDPKYWGIIVLAKIERYSYTQIMNQMNNYDHKAYENVRHHKYTIGQQLKKLKHKIVFKNNFNPYEMFVNGMISTYQEKHDIGFTIPNPDIMNKIDS